MVGIKSVRPIKFLSFTSWHVTGFEPLPCWLVSVGQHTRCFCPLTSPFHAGERRHASQKGIPMTLALVWERVATKAYPYIRRAVAGHEPPNCSRSPFAGDMGICLTQHHNTEACMQEGWNHAVACTTSVVS